MARTYRAGLLCDGPDGEQTGQHDAGVKGTAVDGENGGHVTYTWKGDLRCATCGRTDGFTTQLFEETNASRKARGLEPRKAGTLG